MSSIAQPASFAIRLQKPGKIIRLSVVVLLLHREHAALRVEHQRGRISPLAEPEQVVEIISQLEVVEDVEVRRQLAAYELYLVRLRNLGVSRST